MGAAGEPSSMKDPSILNKGEISLKIDWSRVFIIGIQCAACTSLQELIINHQPVIQSHGNMAVSQYYIEPLPLAMMADSVLTVARFTGSFARQRFWCDRSDCVAVQGFDSIESARRWALPWQIASISLGPSASS